MRLHAAVPGARNALPAAAVGDFISLGLSLQSVRSAGAGKPKAIQDFCSLNFGVTFPLFSKIDVKGPNAHPLFRYLVSRRRGLLGTRAIKWNFTKFLVDRFGEVRRRYGPRHLPADRAGGGGASLRSSLKTALLSVSTEAARLAPEDAVIP